MSRLPANAKRCFRGALTLATVVSAVLLACLAAARVWMIAPPEGEYAISVTDQLHVLFDASWSPGIGRAIICNSDLQVAAHYGDTLNKGRDPRRGTTYKFPGLRHLRVPSNKGSTTYWFTAISLWWLIALCGVLPVVWAGKRLWRSRCRFSLRTLLLGMFAVAFFFGCWSLTSVLGTRDVTEHLAQFIVAAEPSGGDSRRVERDPIANNLEEEYRIPCHYAANASSPFPLIVAVDWAKVIYVPYGRPSEPGDRYHGESGRAVFLWLFGLKIELPHWHRAGTTVMGGG